jgi:hypothetical protein
LVSARARFGANDLRRNVLLVSRETRKTMHRLKKAHAIFNSKEKAFSCLICEEASLKNWIYDPLEIPRHLKEYHKIDRKKQIILDWNENFEKEYLKNRNRPIRCKFGQSADIDTTSKNTKKSQRG